MNKKIVITGCAGYIGSKLCEKLLYMGNYHIVGFDSLYYGQGILTYPLLKNITFFNEDITDWSDNLIRHIKEADIVICLAALVGAPLCKQYPEESELINYKWYLKLLEYLKPTTEVIFPSTNSGYGNAGIDICTEETPSNPVSLYAKQKQNTEQILLENLRNVSVFRFATVFGWSWRPRLDLLVNTLIQEAYTTKKIKVFNPNVYRNYIHINDITSALLSTIKDFKNFRGEIFNLGNDALNCTKLELAQNIASMTESVIEMVDGEDPDKRDYIVSSKKIMDKGFRPYYDLEYGVKEMCHMFSFMNDKELFLKNY